MERLDRQDGEGRTGDGLDRIVDEAVEAALGAGPVDLRAQVLARLDEPADSQRRPSWLSVPALLPVAGTLLMMAGVGLLWQHANDQLGQRERYAASHRVSGNRQAGAAAPVAAPAAALTASAGPASTDPPTATVSRLPVRRAKAPAWLESDNEQKVAGASALLANANLDEPDLPGAPAGDLGDPISPMPRLRPIVIQPITTPSISDVPPVSTLSKPVSTLTDEAPRDRQDPAKSGGE